MSVGIVASIVAVILTVTIFVTSDNRYGTFGIAGAALVSSLIVLVILIRAKIAARKK